MIARLSVRQLTHTLHLPPAQSEIYGGPHPKWLRDVLEQLPHLQNLIVSQLPFFDHSALRLYGDTKKPELAEGVPTFALRLLIAAQCRNTTSSGLADFLMHFPNLVFLDLSNTLATRDKSVLSNLCYMPNLQVLKLRQVNLRDEDVEIVASAVGICVRSLDIRGNLLTDISAETLLRFCFIAPDVDDGLTSTGNRQGGASLEDWPAGISRPDPDLLDDFRHDTLDEHFVKQLAKAAVRRLPSEDLPYSGITHLYISDNQLTATGFTKLIRSGRLFVLDAGSFSTLTVHEGPRSLSSNLERSSGIGGLVHLFEKHCFRNLTSLRIHHALLTKKTSAKENGLSPPPSIFEMSAEDTRHELDTPQPISELSIEETESLYELPGDALHVLVTPALGEKPVDPYGDVPSLPRGSVYAPEVVEEADSKGDAASILTPAGLGSMAQAVNGISGGDKLPGQIETPDLSISLIDIQRQQLRSRLLDKPYALAPGMLPKLRTLTLTDVPCHDQGSLVTDALIQFLCDCGLESRLAELETNLRKPQSAQSGRARSDGDPREIFALSRIVLEMAPPGSSSGASNPFRAPQPSSSVYRSKSITEDADSDSLWYAGENDFSFFDTDEECGLPATEPGLQVPLSTLTEKMTVVADDTQRNSIQPALQQPTGLDVIQELSIFRKQRKAAYEDAVRRGESFVEGFWSGEVKIVRWNGTQSYGNESLDGLSYGVDFRRGSLGQ